MKEAVFHRAILPILRAFPKEVRRAFGKAIYELQNGILLTMPLSKTIRTVAQGANELRVQGEEGSYRVLYYTKLKDQILVFHAFEKKTRKTPNREILLGKKRLKELIDEQS